MSREYAEKKIKEALHLTRGNATKARQQVIAWAMEDHKLLKELVRPHMIGITAHAVGRVMSGKTEPEPVPMASVDPQEDKNNSFGMEILRTIAGGDTAQFGQENFGRPVKKQSASQAHIDAIQAMINKSKK
ncbi:MAG: hypothetical protein R3D88_01730 [Alphaproteobacteria bacterium]|nr:hypothetical protein [Alphaproteobacteria bacterium]